MMKKKDEKGLLKEHEKAMAEVLAMILFSFSLGVAILVFIAWVVNFWR